MKQFLLKILCWVVPILALYAVLGSFADGNTDDNYLDFTRQGTNIIMGDSRGAQAINSYVLEDKFPGRNFDNFALNITYSPYGEIYFKALKRKLKSDTKDGIFILTVDPWNLSISKTATTLSEEPSALNNMWFYNLSPNYEYLIKNYHQSWFNIFRDRETVGKSNAYLHKNGWLEVNVDMSPTELEKRVTEKVVFYKTFAADQKLSPYRLKYFEECIKYLNEHGKVYIVRIPASAQIAEIEKNYAPDFNVLMEKIAVRNYAEYFYFDSENYQYTDGNHMYKDSGKILTAQIADSIKASRLK